MEGTRIVLVRHGESMAQELGIVGGHKGCQGLSDVGRRQANALRDRLATTGELSDTVALYASLMPRAAETAAIIAPALGGAEVVQECAFCEIHPGEGDGLDWDEYSARWPVPDEWDPELRRDPGSETWNEMHDRVAAGLDAVVERHGGSTVVIACHGGVIVQTMFRWLGLSASGERRAWISPANTSLTEWRFAPNPFAKHSREIELVRYNDHSHLTAAPRG